MPTDTLFAGWDGIIRILIFGVPVYVTLVFILRLAGKGSRTGMNAIDLIVIVSIGSILATMLLSKSVALAEGITALSLLLFLQFAISWISVRFTSFHGLVQPEPALLYHNDTFMDEALKRQRVSRDEVLQTVLSRGMNDMSEVGFVILEADGSISVLPETRKKTEKLLSAVSRGEAH